MSIRSINTIFSSRAKAMVLVATIIASFYAVVVPAGQAEAATNPDKVTICHRTHSTTNPYRMITISKNAADGELNPPSSGNVNASSDHAGLTHNKRLDIGTGSSHDYSTNDPSMPVVNGVPLRVFDPSYQGYSGSNKMWEDIIPPFTKTVNGTVISYPGLNWTEKGKAAYYGLTLNGVSYAGVCKAMGAKEYYNSETTSGNQSQSNAIADLRGQGNTDQDGNIQPNTDPNSLPSLPVDPKGPKKPAALNNLLTNLGNTNSNKTPDQMTQAIAGVVWYDNNRDGIQDQSELLAPGVGIVLKDPAGNLYTVGYKKGAKNGVKLADYTSSKKQIFSFANTSGKSTNAQLATTVLTVTTDANGYFQFPSVPEGEWQVIVVTPTGYSYTYDSSGSSDGIMPGTLVPAGGVGFAWAGLVTEAQVAAENAAAEAAAAALAKTGVNSTGWIAGAIALQMIGLGVVLMWLRRRKG